MVDAFCPSFSRRLSKILKIEILTQIYIYLLVYYWTKSHGCLAGLFHTVSLELFLRRNVQRYSCTIYRNTLLVFELEDGAIVVLGICDAFVYPVGIPLLSR